MKGMGREKGREVVGRREDRGRRKGRERVRKIQESKVWDKKGREGEKDRERGKKETEKTRGRRR